MWFSLLQPYGMGHSLHCCHVIQPASAVWSGSQSALLSCDSACLSRMERVTLCIVAMWFNLLEPYGKGYTLHCCHVIQPVWAVWKGLHSALLPCDSTCLSRMERFTLCIVAMWFNLFEPYGKDYTLHCCHVIQPVWAVWKGLHSALLPCDSTCLSLMERVTLCIVAMWFNLLEPFGMGHSLHCCHVIKPAGAVGYGSQSALLPCNSSSLSRLEWITVCIVAMWFTLLEQ